jgi:hypothetical protein
MCPLQPDEEPGYFTVPEPLETNKIDSSFCTAMAEYNAWMNGRLYQVCTSIPELELKRDRGAFFRSIYSTLNHLLYGDLAFMSRFTGDPAVVPELGCVFRLKPITDSGASRSPSPAEADH